MGFEVSRPEGHLYRVHGGAFSGVVQSYYKSSRLVLQLIDQMTVLRNSGADAVVLVELKSALGIVRSS